MDYRRQRYFMAVAESLGFRRAANVLNVSQPSLSQQIQLLEEDLQITLFERTPRATKLTAAGAEYYQGLVAAFSELDLGVKRAKDAHSGRRGTLSVAANTMLLLSHLPKIVPAFRASFPDVELELSTAVAPQAMGLLRDRKVDLVLSGRLFPEDDVQIAPFCEFPWRVMLPLEHRLAQAGEVDLEQLSGETLVLSSHFSSLLGHDDILGMCRERNMRPGDVRRLPGDSPVAPVGFVACGLGFSIISAGYEHQFPMVRFLPIAGLDRKVVINSGWRTDHQNPVIAKFLHVAQGVLP